MAVYLDNAAAAPCDPLLLSFLTETALRLPGNQESMGFHGESARREVIAAGERLRTALGFSGTCRTFFGNTGSDVLALGVEIACRSLNGKGEVLTTVLEHPALEYALRRSCAAHGLTLRICPADRSGIDWNRLEALLSEKTALVALHHVQSETGGIADLNALRALMDRKAPGALLLTDTMQSAGKLPLDVASIRMDFAVLSGQKLGAPGGAALICPEKLAKIASGLRSIEHFSSRCPPPVILTLARCVESAVSAREKNFAHAVALKRLLETELIRLGLHFPFTLASERTSPFIVHLLTAPYQGAILTRALHLHEISVAPGSACESETPGGSRVLSAMGFTRKESFGGLRISTWTENTPQEMVCFAEKLEECIRHY